MTNARRCVDPIKTMPQTIQFIVTDYFLQTVKPPPPHPLPRSNLIRPIHTIMFPPKPYKPLRNTTLKKTGCKRVLNPSICRRVHPGTCNKNSSKLQYSVHCGLLSRNAVERPLSVFILKMLNLNSKVYSRQKETVFLGFISLYKKC